MSEANGNANGRLTTEQVEALIREEFPTLKIEQGKIKLREWEALEEETDKPVTPWIGASFPPMWFIRGQFWLWLRRTHPELRYEDLADLDSDLLMETLNLKEAAEGSDPTQAATTASGDAPEQPTLPASATSGG